MNLLKSALGLLLLLNMGGANAQLRERIVKLNVVPDHEDWKYEPGENVEFEVSVTKNRVPMKGVTVWYEISKDMMSPLKKDTVVLKNGTLTIQAGTMKEPGFLRCRVWTRYEGKSLIEGRGTAAFTPEKLLPVAEMPEDFESYWNNALRTNKKLPMDVKLRLLPDRCTEKVNVYEWSMQNHHAGSRMYGILCIPAAPGKYPALLKVPGAGVRPYAGAIEEAEKGIITLEVGIHGIPVTMPTEVYTALAQGGLYRCQYQNWDNRDEVYYKRVYLGCARAVDYLCSMDKFDGKNLVVYGGSQGGALSIVTAALNPRVTGVVSFFPALSDLGGDLKGRAGGWPHLFMRSTDSPEVKKLKQKVTEYYDVVNFAKRIKVPVFFYLGYNDMVCPPTTTYSVYNTLTSPKQLLIMEEAEHYAYPEHWAKAMDWAYSILHVSLNQ